MIKHFCDRCGKETEFEVLTLNKFNIEPSIYTDNCKEHMFLCPDCQKELMRWVREIKEASGQIPPAVERIESMQKKIEALTRIGNNICFYVREVTSGKQAGPNSWLSLGKLMEEWEGKGR